MTEFHTAYQIVSDRLLRIEQEINEYGSALPNNINKQHLHLVISKTDEYEFGWVFYYTTKEYLETNNMKYVIVGNAPFIVDRNDGKLYVTGTSNSIKYYIEEYRKGNRKIA